MKNMIKDALASFGILKENVSQDYKCELVSDTGTSVQYDCHPTIQINYEINERMAKELVKLELNTLSEFQENVGEITQKLIPSSETLNGWGSYVGDFLKDLFPADEPKICDWDDFACHQEAFNQELLQCSGENNTWECYLNKAIDYLNQYDYNEVSQDAWDKYPNAILIGAATTALVTTAAAYLLYRKIKSTSASADSVEDSNDREKLNLK